MKALYLNLDRLCYGVMLLLFCSACSQPSEHARAAFVLVDISSDYARERHKAETLSRVLLARLDSGDSLAIAFIDNSSFTERNIIARATFDHRPSVAIAQKRQLQAKLTAFMERFKVPSHHSDITGGVLLARDYLHETQARHKQLYILSDLHEDLPPWLERDLAFGLDGIEVIAVNVKRQRSDNNNPAAYRERLAHWQQRVEASGGQWQLVNDLSRFEAL